MRRPADPLVTCDPDALADSLLRLEREDAVAVPALGPAARQRLAEAAEALDFRTAAPVVGAPGREVTQDFAIADDVPDDSLFGQAAREFQDAVNAVLAGLQSPPFESIDLNDRVVQRYPESEVGISPHRDHVRYVKLVANLAIQGHGAFHVSEDRAGTDTRTIRSVPGDAILMRAPGYRGSRRRPFHAIGRVDSARLILGLRELAPKA